MNRRSFLGLLFSLPLLRFWKTAEPKLPSYAINAVDLSKHCKSVSLTGLRDWTCTIEFEQDYTSGQVYRMLAKEPYFMEQRKIRRLTRKMRGL